MQQRTVCVLMLIAAIFFLAVNYLPHKTFEPTFLRHIAEPVSDRPQPRTCQEMLPFYSESEVKGAGLNKSLVAESWCLPQPRYLPLPPDNMHNCSLPYVSMNTKGRLGNKMCQYMSLALLRKVFGIRVAMVGGMKIQIGPFFPKLSIPVEDHKCFPGHDTTDDFNNLYLKLIEWSAGRGTTLSDSQLHPYPLTKSTYVRDYPCPRNLLLPLRDHFREELSFQPETIKKARYFLDNALKSVQDNSTEEMTIITVHVRRTDYLTFITYRYNILPLSMIYFVRAFNYYRERFARPVFVMTSDDPKWCKKHLVEKDVVFAGSGNAVVDMAILSLGDHHVITYGTYGFVSAFLGRGTIVYPDQNGKPISYCFNSTFFQPIYRD
ncbi:galactoside 2-alpha-L-fucosyltransferase Sec1-like isoform X2 [Cherax quadricarinatus]